MSADRRSRWWPRGRRGASLDAGRRPETWFTVIPHGPNWAVELLRPAPGPVPWSRMARAFLGVGIALGAGLMVGQWVLTVLVAVGALVAALADRPGELRVRVAGITLAGAGSVVGVLLGTAIHGEGWLTVAALVLVAGVSALISSLGVAWSLTGLCLLALTVLGTGPLGALHPWWLPAALLPAGTCWSLLLLLGGWLFRSRTAQRKPLRPVVPNGPLPRRLVGLVQEARTTFNAAFALRLMACILVAAVLAEVLPLGRSYWVVLAVAVVVKPDFGSIFGRALQFVAGTLIGAVIGALIVAAGPPAAVFLAPAVILAALLPFGMSRNYGLFVLLLTPFIIVLIDTLTYSGWALAQGRLTDIALGCAIVLGIGYAPWPSTWHASLPRVFATAVDGAADYLDCILSATGISAATAEARAHERLAAVEMEFRRVKAEPEAARRQVMAWKPRADALRHVLDALSATGESGWGSASPAELAQVSHALREIAAAVRSGGTAPHDLQLPRSRDLEPVTESVRCIWNGLPGQRDHPAPDPRGS